MNSLSLGLYGFEYDNRFYTIINGRWYVGHPVYQDFDPATDPLPNVIRLLLMSKYDT